MKIEQMLHGYDHGHRLLAASIILNSQADMDTIALLSDWSEYVAGNKEDSSYITAYPLRDSGFFVFAKTWYAEEMRRPGCVWTHSLLVPFNEMNSVDDFRRLNTLFIRPGVNDGFDIYSTAIEYQNKNTSRDSYKQVVANRRDATIAFSAFVNGGPPAFLWAGLKSNNSDLLFALMNVLPMPMASKVSWCTGASYIRKIYDKPMTCQFLSGYPEIGATSQATDDPQWVSYVLDGVLRGDVNQGQLIRMFANDIGDGVKEYMTVVSVLYTLEDYFNTKISGEERFREVLMTIAKGFPKFDKGTVIKNLCCNKSFCDRFCSEMLFFYYFATLPIDGVFNLKDTKITERWNNYLSANRSDYCPLLRRISEAESINEWGRTVICESAVILSTEEISHLISEDPHLFNSIVQLNPSVLNRIIWESIKAEEVEFILPMVLDSRAQIEFSHWDSLLETVLVDGIEISRPLASVFFSKTDRATAILLDYLNGETGRSVGLAMGNQLALQTSSILDWLDGVETLSGNVKRVIVNVIDEHSSEVISRGADVWRSFIRFPYYNLSPEVYSFMFSLSFNWMYDSTALELMRISFYPLHTLQANGRVRYAEWSRISPYMESLSFFEDWDKCKKMRKTVVMRLKRANLSIGVLDSFTPDSALNEQLKRMWGE